MNTQRWRPSRRTLTRRLLGILAVPSLALGTAVMAAPAAHAAPPVEAVQAVAPAAAPIAAPVVASPDAAPAVVAGPMTALLNLADCSSSTVCFWLSNWYSGEGPYRYWISQIGGCVNFTDHAIHMGVHSGFNLTHYHIRIYSQKGCNGYVTDNLTYYGERHPYSVNGMSLRHLEYTG